MCRKAWSKPRNIDRVLTSCISEHPTLKHLPKSWRVYVTRNDRGYCSFSAQVITIPSWAWTRGPEYVEYYIAHEVSHYVAWVKYKDPAHGAGFYKAFKEICPPTSLHYELNYKPRNAKSNGITRRES